MGKKSYKQKTPTKSERFEAFGLGEPDITEIISNDTHF